MAEWVRQKTCPYVLLSFKTCISCRTSLAWYGSETVPPTDTASNECWAKPNQTSCSRFAQASFHTSSHVLLFSCLSKKTWSSVLMSVKKTCSFVLMSLIKNLSFCSSVFKHPFSCLHNKKDGSEQALPIPNRLSIN